MVRPGKLYTILTKGVKLWRTGQHKVKGFGLLGVVNYGKVNIRGRKRMEVKGYFSKLCLCRLISVQTFYLL